MAVEEGGGRIEDYRAPAWPEDFGERLGRLMEMIDLSRRDMAELFGVTERTVQKWLKGGVPTGASYWGILQLSRTIPGGFELILYGKGVSDANGEE